MVSTNTFATQKHKKILSYSQNPAEVYIGNSFSLRESFKHLLVIAYLAIGIYTMLKIEVPSNTDGWMNIAWLFSIYMSIMVTFKKALFLVMSTFSSFILMVALVSSFFGYGLFLLFYVENLTPNSFAEFYKLSIWMLPIVGSSIVWFPIIAFFEKRSRPIWSQALLWRAFNNLLIFIILLIFYFELDGLSDKGLLANLSFGNKTFVELIIWSSTLLGILLISYTLMQRKYKAFVNDEWENKNIAYAASVTMLVPLIVGFIKSGINWRETWQANVYIGVLAGFCLLFTLITFVKKSPINSSKIYVTIVALVISLIWMTHYSFEEYFIAKIPNSLLKAGALIATAYIAVLAYFKSTPINNSVMSKLYEFTFSIIGIITIAYWVINELEFDLSALPIPITAILNLLLMCVPIILLAVSVILWYVNQKIVFKTAGKILKYKKGSKNGK